MWAVGRSISSRHLRTTSPPGSGSNELHSRIFFLSIIHPCRWIGGVGPPQSLLGARPCCSARAVLQHSPLSLKRRPSGRPYQISRRHHPGGGSPWQRAGLMVFRITNQKRSVAVQFVQQTGCVGGSRWRFGLSANTLPAFRFIAVVSILNAATSCWLRPNHPRLLLVPHQHVPVRAQPHKPGLRVRVCNSCSAR